MQLRLVTENRKRILACNTNTIHRRKNEKDFEKVERKKNKEKNWAFQLHVLICTTIYDY